MWVFRFDFSCRSRKRKIKEREGEREGKTATEGEEGHHVGIDIFRTSSWIIY